MTRSEKRLAVVLAWAEKAQGDLQTARECVGNPRIPTWVVGFHLQQALEKVWKGRLVLERRRPPPVHDLRALLQMLDPDASGALVTLAAILQPFAVEERYPLLTPRESDREELAEVLPQVEAEVRTLLDAIQGFEDPLE